MGGIPPGGVWQTNPLLVLFVPDSTFYKIKAALVALPQKDGEPYDALVFGSQSGRGWETFSRVGKSPEQIRARGRTKVVAST